jgi:hypothetical protein
MANINPPVTTQLGHADPNASPLTVNELIDLFNTLFHSEIQGDYIPYVIGSDTPDVDDNHKAWIKLDTGGRPIAIMVFYNGNWRRIYNGMIGEIRGFSGAPGFSAPPAKFDVNGKGNIGGDYDGWQICNGKNGSPDVSDKFVIGAHMNNSNSHSGYNQGWQTFVDTKSDLKNGGGKDVMIGQVNLPGLDTSGTDPSTGIQQSPGVWINGNEYKQDTTSPHTDANFIIDPSYANLKHHSIKLFTYGADVAGHPSNPPNPQQPVPILPPFYVMAWIIFIGY